MRSIPFVDGHSHVTPRIIPNAPSAAVHPRWPCMRCDHSDQSTLMIGEQAFRTLDTRSWEVERRIEDLDRDGIAMQLLSPMPELLSYWFDADDAELICDVGNAQIAEMVARAPRRFRGLGAVPLQNPALAAAKVGRLKTEFGLSGIEIGSNICGDLLGDPKFDIFWAAVEEAGMAVFIHALHPVAAKAISATPEYTAFALFPVDVAMAAASLLMGGVLDRFPRLRIALSHGGGALGSILGRLDIGWSTTDGYSGVASRRPSEQARSLFYDSNVYDPAYLHYLVAAMAPGHVFAGTDYPYAIMQRSPVDFIRRAITDPAMLKSISIDAISAFLSEDLSSIVTEKI